MSNGKGVIHDLGYARYAGERRSPATLWRVIMRQHLSYAWKTFWRFKLWVGFAVLITVIVGGAMYLQANDTISMMRKMGHPVVFIEAALPLAYEYYRMAAFMVSMTIGAAVIARDQESGAFTFYFSRPVRPLDYVLGKLAGQMILMAVIFLAGPLLLAGFRVGLAGENALDYLIIFPRVLAVGALATVVFAALPLAISSVSGRRTLALGLWAAYYIAGVKVVAIIGSFSWKPLMAIDPGASMGTVALGLFEIEVSGKAPPMWAAVGSMLAQSALAIWILVTQVRKQAEGAVGGSS